MKTPFMTIPAMKDLLIYFLLAYNSDIPSAQLAKLGLHGRLTN
jgi:hypothetical protein